MRRGGTAFVLTGGGSLGAVQVGMAMALHEHGIDPDVLVGTSVGAVNAAYLAGPGTTEERLAVWPHSGPVCAGGTCSVSSRDGGDGPPSEQNRRCSPATRCACCSRDTWATTPSRTPGSTERSVTPAHWRLRRGRDLPPARRVPMRGGRT